jgi:hypothetical protein
LKLFEAFDGHSLSSYRTNPSQSSTSEGLFLTQGVAIMTDVNTITVIVPAIVLVLEIAWIMREG